MRKLKRANIPTKDLLGLSIPRAPVQNLNMPVPSFIIVKIPLGRPRAVTKARSKNYLPLSTLFRSTKSKWLTSTFRPLGTPDKKLFVEVATNSSHKLHSLLPDSNSCQYNLRSQRRKLIVLRTCLALAYVIVNIFNFCLVLTIFDFYHNHIPFIRF